MTLQSLKESIVFLVGIVVSSMLIPLVLPLFRKLGVVDLPNARSSHTTAIPRGVGIVLVLTFAGIILGYNALSPDLGMREKGYLEAVIWSVLLLVAVGFLDDTRGVSAGVKFVFQAGSAVILITAGLVMPLPGFFGEHQVVVEKVFTLLWVIGVINAVNFIDGSDGLATMLCTLATILFVGISRILPGEYVKACAPLIKTINLLGLAVAGCALPFLLYNISPAKCFLGDSGSTFFGLVLAVLGLLTSRYNAPQVLADIHSGFSLSFFLVPWLVLFVPIADAGRVTIGRVLKGKSPFRPDNRHLHHVLHRAGLSPNQMLFLVSLGVLIFGMTAAILVRSSESPYILMGIVVLLIYGMFWFLKSSYRARRFVTLALNRRLLAYMEVKEGFEDPASFKERFEQELARAKRHTGVISAVVVNINATSRKLNSPGASPLENPKFLETLLKGLRREDIKCRFSNDRLAFLLVETNKERAAYVLRRLVNRFESIKQGESADLQVAIGVASYPIDGDNVKALLQKAEADALGQREAPAAVPAAVPAAIALGNGNGAVRAASPTNAPALLQEVLLQEVVLQEAVPLKNVPQDGAASPEPPPARRGTDGEASKPEPSGQRHRWDPALAEKETLVPESAGGSGKRWFSR